MRTTQTLLAFAICLAAVASGARDLSYSQLSIAYSLISYDDADDASAGPSLYASAEIFDFFAYVGLAESEFDDLPLDSAGYILGGGYVFRPAEDTSIHVSVGYTSVKTDLRIPGGLPTVSSDGTAVDLPAFKISVEEDRYDIATGVRYLAAPRVELGAGLFHNGIDSDDGESGISSYASFYLAKEAPFDTALEVRASLTDNTQLLGLSLRLEF